MTDTEFRTAVYSLIARIPPGKVVTFGQLAALTGNPMAARRAARAAASAPHGLPCHRVVKAGGELVPEYVFGRGEQRAALTAEGVLFDARGRVRLSEHIWQPTEPEKH